MRHNKIYNTKIMLNVIPSLKVSLRNTGTPSSEEGTDDCIINAKRYLMRV